MAGIDTHQETDNLEKQERSAGIEGDPPDLAPGLPGGRREHAGAPGDGRVDEREAVVLAHQERVDEAQSIELDQVLGDLDGLHALHPSMIIGCSCHSDGSATSTSSGRAGGSGSPRTAVPASHGAR